MASMFSKNASHSMEFLELVNCRHEGFISLQVLGLVTQFYAYFFAEEPVTMIHQK